MKKISWSEIQLYFPKAAHHYASEFKKLFERFGSDSLTVEDIDLVLKESEIDPVKVQDLSIDKQSSFVRYFYDSIGQILGRIETDDEGNSQAYDKSGMFVGSLVGGQTLNASGEIVAQSDVLSGLIIREERVVGKHQPRMFEAGPQKRSDGWHAVGDDGRYLGGPFDSRSEAEKVIQRKQKGPGVFIGEQTHEAIGIDYLELEDEPVQEYVPVSKGRGKFKVYDIVMTPYGKGRIITKQTEDKPYTYGVMISKSDELEIVEEQDIELYKEKESVVVNPQQTQQGYSLDAVTVADVHLAADVGWLRDLWVKHAGTVMRDLADVNAEFKKDQAEKKGPGPALYDYYSTSRYESVEEPLRLGTISKDQAEKLLRDLMYQFRAELYTTYGLSAEKIYKDEEQGKESVVEKDLPAYGVADVFPYSGTGAGMPSTTDLTRITNDIPSRDIQVI